MSSPSRSTEYRKLYTIKRREFWRDRCVRGLVKYEDIPRTFRHPTYMSRQEVSLRTEVLKVNVQTHAESSRNLKLLRQKKCIRCEILLSSKFAGDHDGIRCETCKVVNC